MESKPKVNRVVRSRPMSRRQIGRSIVRNTRRPRPVFRNPKAPEKIIPEVVVIKPGPANLKLDEVTKPTPIQAENAKTLPEQPQLEKNKTNVTTAIASKAGQPVVNRIVTTATRANVNRNATRKKGCRFCPG